MVDVIMAVLGAIYAIERKDLENSGINVLGFLSLLRKWRSKLL